jgi:hypothetical protein
MLLSVNEVYDLIEHVKEAANDEKRTERRRIRMAESGLATEVSMAIAVALNFGIKNGEA